MPGRSEAAALPSSAALRAYLLGGDTPVGLTDMLRAFERPIRDKARLKTLLHAMALDGSLLDLPAGRLKTSIGLPETARARITHIRMDGTPCGVLADNPAATPVTIQTLAPDLPYPLPGDVFLVRLRPANGHYRREARAECLLARTNTPLAFARALGADGAPLERLWTCNPHITGTFALAEPELFPLPAPGDVVLGSLQPMPDGTLAVTKPVPYGHAKQAGMACRLSLLTYGVPTRFSSTAEQEGEYATALVAKLHNQPAPANRRDLRSLPLITLDDETAQDFDDAIWAETTEDGFHLLIAIADVGHYVPHGSALDMEARQRGTSVYLPDQSVPMLPPSLSANACSLLPGLDRLCLFADMHITHDGTVRHGTIGQGIMRSAARLTYRDAQDALDGKAMPPEHPIHTLPPTLLGTLKAAGNALDLAATQRGALRLDEDALVITFHPDGQPAAFQPRERLATHDLVASFMIAANTLAAEIAHKNQLPVLFRVHPAPTVKRPRPAARYSTIAERHNGLGLPLYTHFTSPIRRYADLVAHRALTMWCQGTTTVAYAPPAMQDNALVSHLNFTEKRAAQCVQDSQNRLAAAFLAPCVGQNVNIHATTTTRQGLCVRLTKTGTPSLLPWSAVPDYARMNDDSLYGKSAARHTPPSQSGALLKAVLLATCPARGVSVLASPHYAC
ncbi:RNB domain-containing ribonuclease [Acetobacter syzygii]|uniref:RNB domain-containing ribonuclease n=1 Tax=Acetobacter syzygii TaxID=146476 RepID=UPI001570C7CD|nr:ribonuclease R family protein [Acetobacter syzygii]NSL92216.1 VacB/RNase II family 3'-5' exoribonuclease [Acetobacter syzygii]